ncbi:MAG: fibronectin type III domain-containing protein, partial [Solirubrobacteraceae bacterium]|nr:fibronectin type III domain-containing protein [Solirubrobacteraceae bacterium]
FRTELDGGLALIAPIAETAEAVEASVGFDYAQGGANTSFQVAVSLGDGQVPNGSGPTTLDLSGSGLLPSFAFVGANPLRISATGFRANLRFKDAGQPVILPPVTRDIDGNLVTPSDTDPTTVDIYCKIDPPTQPTTLAVVNAEPIACPPLLFPPPAPISAPISDADIGSTSVNLRWSMPAVADECDGELGAFKVSYNGRSITVPADARSLLITDLAPATAYEFSVASLTGNNGVDSLPLKVNVTTDPAPTGQTVKYSYGLAGTAGLKTLTKGTLPITGGIDADLTLATGAFTADLALNPTQGRLVAAGFLPVTAKIGFVPTGKTTGTLLDGVLESTSKVRIKVQEVKLFGAIPLAGGNNCQTKSLSEIKLKSTDEFKPLQGGNIAGTFKISDLNGCGPLNGLVSPLTAGAGNTLALKLTPKVAPAPGA